MSQEVEVMNAPRRWSMARAAFRLSCGPLLLVLGACSGDATAPPITPEGTYELTSYGGSALPVTLRAIVSVPAGGTCEDRLTAMTLVLGADGRFVRSAEHRLVCDTGAPDEVTHPSAAGSYVRSGTGISLEFDPVMGTVTTATGTLDATGIVITRQVMRNDFAETDVRTRLEFRRVR
jgi:hypothetical protein